MHPRTPFHAFSVIPYLAPCLALSLLAQTPEDPAAAPKEAPQTVKIAAHGSRWDYPKEVAVGPNTQLHIVAKGDTLWDLSAKYLGNPFAWPQIWELNKWVRDPHWIYPGDPLLVDGSRRAVPQAAQDLANDEVADLQPDRKRGGKPTRDEYAFTFQDFIQLPFLTPLGVEGYMKKQGALKIVGRQDATKNMQGNGDVVYVNGGSRQGFKAGDRLVTMQLVSRKFHHPDDRYRRHSLGDIIQQTGVVRLTHTYPNQSMAIVERSMDGLQVGSYAAPFVEPANIVANPRTDIQDPVQLAPSPAKVIYIREDKSVAGAGDMLIIDQGSKAGLKVGDMLLTTRTSPLDPTSKAAAQDVTHVYLGQLVVVRTEEQSATCRMLRSNTEILVGDLATR